MRAGRNHSLCGFAAKQRGKISNPRDESNSLNPKDNPAIMRVDYNSMPISMQSRERKIKSAIAYLIIVLFSINLTIFNGEGQRNLLLISFMYCVPFLMIWLPGTIHVVQLPALTVVSLMSISALLNYKLLRISSLMYSWMFTLSFVYYLQYLYANFITFYGYKKILKILFFSFVIILLLQEIACLLGLPIINYMLPDGYNGRWSLNGLATETSYNGSTLFLFFWSYISCLEIEKERKIAIADLFKDRDLKYVFPCYAFCMFTMGSTTAILMFSIGMLYFLNIYTFVPLLLLGMLVFSSDVEVFMRAKKMLIALTTFDIDNVISADHSGSFRFAYSLAYVKMTDFLSLKAWMGYGIDYDKDYYYGIIHGIENTDRNYGGLLAAFPLDYGLIVFFLFFFCLLFYCVRKKHWFDFVEVFVMINMLSFNFQLTWLMFILYATNKFFYIRMRADFHDI